jgi:uncharacterized protein
MATNIDIVRTGYESFCRGDIQTARAMFAEDIEWRESHRPAGPVQCLFRGRDQVLLRVFTPVPGIHDALAVEAREFVADGETVVVTGVFHVDLLGVAGPTDVPFAHVWSVHAGRIDGLRSCDDAQGTADAACAA